MAKPLQPEDRRRELTEIDPSKILDKTSCGGVVNYETKIVTFWDKWCFDNVARYLGLKIADDAVAFEAYGWKWMLARD